MDRSRPVFPAFGASDDSVPWLDVCPPLQPASLDSAIPGATQNGAAASRDSGPGDACTTVVDGRSQDRGPRRIARTSDGPTQHAGFESDGSDLVSHRERLEMLHAAAAEGIDECPTWLILAIEREPVGPEF